ncbi:MAG: hypothetical protein CO099_02450 [Bdellovibrio sp. CG_4_9_14_3_um_filter_39_7]|nr:MAG: hypothetical protein CO099_02450 [Bdellovibrio sp. CG_4_9_14_3_um_filter_39_7]
MTNYSPIRISTLKSKLDIPFPLFIHFRDHYLEYAKAGSQFTDDKFIKLKRQKIARFYILDVDEKKYQNFLDELLNKTLNDPNTKIEAKVDLVQGAAETALDNMQANPQSQASYKMTQNAAKKVRELVQKNPDALKFMFGNNQESEPIIKHSINVCTLCIKLASHYKLPDSDIDHLATAALMHDIGVGNLDENTQLLFKKPKQELDAQERQAYFHHCFNIFRILKEKPYATPEVMELVENHEENKSGSGPNKKTKLSRSEEILSLVNTYDKRVTIEGMKPQEAMKKMMIEELGNYELKSLQTLQEILKKEKLF